MKSSKEFEAERLELVAEAEGIYAAAEEAKRELDESEQNRVDEITKEGGLLEQLAANRDKAENRERKRKEFLRDIANSSQPAGTTGGVQKVGGEGDDNPSLPNLRGQKSRFFNEARDAYLASQWFQATVLNKQDAREEINRLGAQEWLMDSKTGAAGGYLVPDPLASEILTYRDEVGVASRVARVIGMTSDTLRINEESTRPTVYYPGQGGEITASNASLVQHKLEVEKRAVLVKMTREWLADAAISAADYIVETMGFQLAYAMDNEFLNGDGTSTYGGEEGLISKLLAGQTEDADTSEDTLEELDLEDWHGAQAELPGLYQSGASWIMSRETYYGSVLPLMIAAGGNTVANIEQGTGADSNVKSFFGRPVYLTDLLPAAAASTVVALYGNWMKAVAIGDRNDLMVDTSDQRFFETDEIAVKACHRYDILVHNTAAYSALKTAA